MYLWPLITSLLNFYLPSTHSLSSQLDLYWYCQTSFCVSCLPKKPTEIEIGRREVRRRERVRGLFSRFNSVVFLWRVYCFSWNAFLRQSIFQQLGDFRSMWYRALQLEQEQRKPRQAATQPTQQTLTLSHPPRRQIRNPDRHPPTNTPLTDDRCVRFSISYFMTWSAMWT